MNVLILILLLAILIAVVLVVLVRALSNAERPLRKSERKREISGGRLVALGDVERDQPIHFAESGTWSSRPLSLESGNYRLRYDFSAGMPVRVGLVSSLDGSDETLLITSGSGVEGFSINEAGSYVVQVQPADESVEWQIELQHLTRYGVQEEDNETFEEAPFAERQRRHLEE